jgi:hypothetical protein
MEQQQRKKTALHAIARFKKGTLQWHATIDLHVLSVNRQKAETCQL